jgi:flagellar motility protein MotE (MotC chaperone)
MFYTGVLRTLIVSAFLLLLVKMVDTIIMASTDLENGILVGESQAEEKKEEHKEEAKHGEEAPAEGGHGGGHGEGGGAPAEPQEKPISVDEVKTYTEAEIEVLERLSERRDRLLKWEKDLQVKENVLKITEEKLDTKIEDLRKLKKEVEASLTEYRKEEDAKTKSLVKIYENMKPKNAADIFSKMRTDDIVPIVGKMKEKNAAEILAKMEPIIAKEVTTKLNNIGKIRSSTATK